MLFEPVKALCNHTKACNIIVDLTQGEGPQAVKDMNGAGVPLVMRREMIDANPALVAAYQAAMKDAVTWANDPANFEEVIKIYTPLISFGDMAGADVVRRNWIKSIIPLYSKDLKVDRKAIAATLKFHLEAKTLEKPVTVEQVVSDKAP